MAAERAPRLALPNVKPSLNAVALPVVSYASLAAATHGVLTVLSPHIKAAWLTYGLVGWCVGLPVASVIGQIAVAGGPGIAKQLGGVRSDDQRLLRLANAAADAVGVEHPQVFELPSREPNAFAASGLFNDKPTVAVTAGLRRTLSEAEMGAVLAHEMGHLRHKDVVRNMHVAAAVAGLGGIYGVGRMLWESGERERGRSDDDGDDDSGSTAALGLGLMAAGALAEGGAHLVRMAASRTAEFEADRAAAEAYGAQTLISALRKIEASSAADLREAAAAKAYAHMMISDGPGHATPRRGLRERASEALRTHPSVERRVAALERAAEQGRVPARGP